MSQNTPNNVRQPRGGRFSTTLDVPLSNLASTGRGRKQAISMLADSLLVVLSLWAAYSLRHGQLFSNFRHTWYLFLLLPLLTVITFSGLGVYRWVIRSLNQRLFKQLLKGSSVSALMLLVVFFLIPPDRVNPRSLFIMFGLLVFLSTLGVRMVWRALFDSDGKGEPVAIYGAGSGGVQLASLLSSESLYRPVVFIDDDSALAKSTIVGLPVVYGKDAQLASVLRRYDVNKVVLAMPSLSSADYHRKLRDIGDLEMPVLTMPSVVELMSGDARANDIRDVSISDILGRGEVVPNVELMSRRVTGKTVLVTGGGGSIGSELCRQVMNLSPNHLIILDNCEANLYHITEELNALATASLGQNRPPFTPLIGSVVDGNRLEQLFTKYEINTVFHAAAYKHVPIGVCQHSCALLQETAATAFSGFKAITDSRFQFLVSPLQRCGLAALAC